MKDDTALDNQAEIEAHEGSMTPALSENVNETPFLSLPQDDPGPLSHAFTESEGETKVAEVPAKSSEEIEIQKGVTNPSEVTQKDEEPAALAEGEGKGEEEGEEKLALPGHQREDHPTA